MSKLQNCDKRLTVGGYGIPAVAINRYNYYWQWQRLLAMAMAMTTAIGYGGCVKTQSMRAALGYVLLPLRGVLLVSFDTLSPKQVFQSFCLQSY